MFFFFPVRPISFKKNNNSFLAMCRHDRLIHGLNIYAYYDNKNNDEYPTISTQSIYAVITLIFIQRKQNKKGIKLLPKNLLFLL